MNEEAMEEKKPILLQFEISPENESNLHKYQGGYMIQEGKKITKATIVNRALKEFFEYNLEERLGMRIEDGTQG